jgi:futalosine hydrolase
MNILVVAATAFEIAPFIGYYRTRKTAMDVDILISGIGLTSTAYHLAKQTSLKRPGMIIQAGVAGCFDKKISLGSVVAVGQEAIADLGVIEEKKLKTLFDLDLVPTDQYPYKKGWMVNPNKELLEKTGLKKVRAVSVNEITTNKQYLKMYVDTFKPAVESMEGAALHYTCLMEKIPFLQLRAVSNYIGERDKKKWKMKLAIDNLNQKLTGLIEKLN